MAGGIDRPRQKSSARVARFAVVAFESGIWLIGFAADRAEWRAQLMKTTQVLDESDLEETFSRSAGPGGQNVNKVASRVTLRHRPTHITVSVQDSRSQSMNRQLARERLLAAIQERERANRTRARQAREKKRRQNAPRPRRVKERMLENKRRRSQLKQSRGRVVE